MVFLKKYKNKRIVPFLRHLTGFMLLLHTPTANATVSDPWELRYEASNILNDIIYSDGLLVAAGNNGLLLTSRDGSAWEQPETGVTNNIISAAYNNGVIVFVGVNDQSGQNGVYTFDLNNGQVNVLEFPFERPEVEFLDSQFYLFGFFYDMHPGQIASSKDGITWDWMTPLPVEGDAYTDYGKCDGGYFAVAYEGEFGGTVLRSFDGLVWKRVLSGPYLEIACGRGKMIAAGGIVHPREGSFNVGISDDGGANWVEYVNNQWNYEWDSNELPQTALLRIEYGRGSFIATGGNAGPEVFATRNGRDWEELPVSVRGIAFGKDSFWGIRRDEIYESSKLPPFIYFTSSSGKSTLKLHIEGTSNVMYRIEQAERIVDPTEWQEVEVFIFPEGQKEVIQDFEIQNSAYYRVVELLN